MRDLNIAIAGFDAAATSHLGYAERGPWQLPKSDQGHQRGIAVRTPKRS